MKSLPLLILLFALSLSYSGCKTRYTVEDSKVDDSLSRPQIPGSGAPEAGPGEPQPGFDQQTSQAQNP